MGSKIEIRKVKDKKMMKQFITLPWTLKLYENDPAWVPPVIQDKMNFLNPQKGYFFEIGEVEYFMAYRDGTLVGRITAQVNHMHEERHDKETGFFGFYESINDVSVAEALFGAAEEWLRNKGKTRMNGPQSFAIYDQIGFEVYGMESTPIVGIEHLAPYYKDLAEACGFKKCIDWHCILVRLEDFKSYFDDIQKNLMKDMDWEYRTLNKKELGKRGRQIQAIFNKAWEENWGHLPLTDKQFDMFFKELKMVVIPELAQFAEKDGTTIGFMLTIPDATDALKKLNGRLYPWRIIKALLEFRKTKKLRTMLMGVQPEYRGKHIDDIFYLKGISWAKKNGYESSDCSLIVETNKKMIGAIKHLNGEIYKTYRLYEKTIT